MYWLSHGAISFELRWLFCSFLIVICSTKITPDYPVSFCKAMMFVWRLRGKIIRNGKSDSWWIEEAVKKSRNLPDFFYHRQICLHLERESSSCRDHHLHYNLCRSVVDKELTKTCMCVSCHVLDGRPDVCRWFRKSKRFISLSLCRWCQVDASQGVEEMLEHLTDKVLHQEEQIQQLDEEKNDLVRVIPTSLCLCTRHWCILLLIPLVAMVVHVHLSVCLLHHVRIAESEPYCHSILFVCLSGCLSVIPWPMPTTIDRSQPNLVGRYIPVLGPV